MKGIVKSIVLSFFLLIMPAPALAEEVTLFAASSLKEAVNDLCERFARRRPGVRITRNYGGSGQLARQVESGAPADIFISANEAWIDRLKRRGLVVPGSIAAFTSNTLVFAGQARGVSSLRDLPALDRIAIGTPTSVPAGEYAMAALKRSGLDRRLEKKLVMTRDVRECLMYAERGEVDGAFVYGTDALQAKGVKVLFPVPPSLYPPIFYPMALTIRGAANGDAVAFLAYLKGKEAETVLARHGFSGRRLAVSGR